MAPEKDNSFSPEAPVAEDQSATSLEEVHEPELGLDYDFSGTGLTGDTTIKEDMVIVPVPDTLDQPENVVLSPSVSRMVETQPSVDTLSDLMVLVEMAEIPPSQAVGSLNALRTNFRQ